MAKIVIEMDTESSGAQSQPSLAASPNQVGLLSSITLTSDMISYFNLGLGGTAQIQDGAGYIAQGVKSKKDTLRANCKVIATVGGSVVLNALSPEISAKMPPFVSLVGSVPTGSIGNCRGGISLESFASDSARKIYLKGLGGGGVYTDASICLYTNPNSAMHAAEQGAWNNNGTFIESYVGGDGTGTNDATKFSWDFNGSGINLPKIPNTANALIISDDPFFQTSQATLVPLLNNWLNTAGRQVVYASQIYASGPVQPATGSTLIGPDLLKAYMLLGALAGSLLSNTASNFGFIKLANETTVY
jgi:hypothetical protein